MTANPYHSVESTVADLTALDGLLYVVRALRDQTFGCPWDKNLTPKDVIPLTIEETYETIEAIKLNNKTSITEELGDLLFHIVLYGDLCNIAFDDIAIAIRDKMIKRHPHVFKPEGTSDGSNVDEDALFSRWEQQKPPQGMKFCRAYPSLMLAERIGKLAAREGFDWENAISALAKVKEEIGETEQAIMASAPDKIAEEYGDMLFASAQLGRKLGLSPEYVLYQAINKFIIRYNVMKQKSTAFKDLSLAKKEALWQEARHQQYMFRKMNGVGNDFVVFDARYEEINLSAEQIRKICDRNIGIGCDQLILMQTPQQPDNDVKLAFYNHDGTPASACGNGTRCIGSLLMEESQKEISIETANRTLTLKKSQDGGIEVNMGRASFVAPTIPVDTSPLLALATDASYCVAVDVGNPHAVFLEVAQDAIEQLDLKTLGSLIEHHPGFPDRCNVSFVSIIDNNHARLRVWERGAGITKACGTAACAVMAALHHTKIFNAPNICLHLDGGTLNVRIDDDLNLWLTGKTETNFHGFWTR